MYLKECYELKMKALSEILCYRILERCGASFRKSLKGLDSMKVDGINGFEKLEEIVECLNSNGLDKDQKKLLLNRINFGLNYLKSGFRKHLEVFSKCSDHCISWALSEPSKNNQQHNLSSNCDHNHKRDCLECVSISTLFEEILKEIEFLIKDQIKKKLYYIFFKKVRITS